MVDYCSVADVKVVLHIDLEEASEDVELAGCVSVGCGLVDGFLKPKDLVVPAVVPLLVVQAATHFAGWAYRRVRDPVKAQDLWDAAVMFLQTYIDAESEPYVGVA